MPTKLIIENCFSHLITDDEKVLNVLWSCLRFRERNYFHNVRYKMKLWDGYTEFFKRETGKFLTGLLPEIRNALKQMNILYETEDNRGTLKFTVDSVDEQWLNKFLQPGMKPVDLRDYQIEYINRIIRHSRGIVFAPTSAGKTNILVGCLLALPPETPTLVLANRKDLVDQNYDEIRQWGFKNVGRFYGDHKEIKTIICATIQSAHLLKKLFPKIKAIFVDEIHEMMSRKPRAVYNACKGACVRVAMSATPFKFGGKDKVQKYEVKGYIGPELIKEDERVTTKKLQDRGFLASVDCTFYPVHEPEIPYHVYMDAVTEGIANNQHLHDMTCKLVKSLMGRTLIIVERVSHGDQLHDLIPNSLWVRGQDDSVTRKSIIKKLKENKHDTVAIATAGIFNTGINVFIHNLINCAGGQAEHQIIQRFGRGLRVAEDKAHLKYFDWYFTINDYLGKHSDKRVDILTKEGHNVVVKECFDL